MEGFLGGLLRAQNSEKAKDLVSALQLHRFRRPLPSFDLLDMPAQQGQK